MPFTNNKFVRDPESAASHAKKFTDSQTKWPPVDLKDTDASVRSTLMNILTNEVVQEFGGMHKAVAEGKMADITQAVGRLFYLEHNYASYSLASELYNAMAQSVADTLVLGDTEAPHAT
jgi:hypothetical protein